VFDFLSRRRAARGAGMGVGDLLDGFSIEVMPRTAAKVDRFADILPPGTRVYIAHVDGTPIDEMVATARRIAEEGFAVMPHLPARSIPDRATLADWLARYRGEAGVREALLIGGGRRAPAGAFDSAMAMIGTGLFDAAGFARLHVAGHPEGNRDIDADGGERVAMEALRWKQDFAARSDAAVAIVTQFCFEAAPVIAWAERLRAAGVGLPVHIGVAGPARLQTLIKYAMMCGVGPSLQVLQRRAADLSRLMLPFTPEEMLADLAAHKAAHPDFPVERVHIFPLGGIAPAAEFAGRFAGRGPARRAAV